MNRLVKSLMFFLAGSAFGGLVAAGAIHLISNIERGKAARNVGDARAIAHAIESYKIDIGKYPPFDGGLRDPIPLLKPYASQLPLTYSYGNGFHVFSTGETFAVVSPGKNGVIIVGQGLVHGPHESR